VSTATRIEWTEVTWNPTTGCDRISPGCDHCYALTLAKRLKAMSQPKYQRDGDPRTSGPGFGVAEHEDVLEEPLRWRMPRKVFVNSMSDISGGVMILKFGSSQVNRYKCRLRRVRQVSRTGGAGR
jgi:protein gp37